MNPRIVLSRAAVLIAFLMLATPTLRAQNRPAFGVIDGVVSDTNLVALADATVSILGSAVRVATGANGRFRITGLRTGNYILAVQRIGYVPIAVAIGDSSIAKTPRARRADRISEFRIPISKSLLLNAPRPAPVAPDGCRAPRCRRARAGFVPRAG